MLTNLRRSKAESECAQIPVTELEEMSVEVLLLFVLFLNPILGEDLVVVSSDEVRGRMSRWKREASLLPRHWIDIQAEIRSRYIKL